MEARIIPTSPIPSNNFFGIADGPITAIPLASATPNHNGDFKVMLPDFNAQVNLGEGKFMFTLTEIKTENFIAFLSDTDDAHGPQGAEG